MLDQRGEFGRKIMDLDYDVYAAGEAELGWLNSSLRVRAPQEFAIDELLLDVIGRLQTSLAEADAEAAHLKAIGLWEGFYGVANLVSSDTSAVLSLPSNCKTREADLVMDVRFLRNPHYVDDLRPLSGRDAAVADYVTADPAFAGFFERWCAMLVPLLPRYVAEGKSYLTIAIGCTGGRHRSVAVSERLAGRLRDEVDHVIEVRHRDIDRGTNTG